MFFDRTKDAFRLLVAPNRKLVVSRTLASGSCCDTGRLSGRSLRLWDTKTAKELTTISYHGPISSLAFTPDGNMLASGDAGDGSDFRVRLWEVASGRQVWNGAGHTYGIGALAFSPDGRLLASGGYDDGPESAVRLWETASGKEITNFKGHHSGVWSLAFSPNGRTLASGGGDSQILLWDITGDASGKRSSTLSQKELTRLRNALAADKAGEAYHAIWSLTAAPRQRGPLP